ncbi:peptide chain release factor N(5)-glutamine methyltransferase [Accumulibacter sp.]|uniref:peptide chain release factor N(5)-glutamine methyltransferase n=1 Tax=Accumulibacter sp. TaxID=2053492 RepID=UPI0025DF7E96|nr:peptide chain release factor N(5)-glutamine methyltransferase [Accumulibacter sp.]MCM8611730.1 peptide chain release factor N(5)-glutamine methyltransferase [Accumulibacter sp.]MCM8635600.1 peptide chain release factor N(5)-glutamine methyltransferase [Accumulibacter sp.]MCM8639199.1 peptide chain release factor N(5)-glutamine methyltransferase [Accumulibacter sp.]
MTTIGEAWRLARQRIDRLDARLLVEHVASCSHADLLAHAGRPLSALQVRQLEALVQRRARGEPLAYLVGSVGFYGREFRVTADVLVPRPETELLLELALERLRALHDPAVADLGTGCGVLAVSLKCRFPQARVVAVDLSPAALVVARMNAALHGVTIRFLEGDWYGPLGAERFDLIVANPPYVAMSDPHLESGGLPFEPRMALTDGVAGGDGLDCTRVIVGGAAMHLLPGGWLLIEHGHDQGVAVRQLLQDAGLTGMATWPDLAGIDRVSAARFPVSRNRESQQDDFFLQPHEL